MSPGFISAQNFLHRRLETADDATLIRTSLNLVLVRNRVGHPGPRSLVRQARQAVLDLRVVTEGDDGQAGVVDEVVTDKLLRRLVNPLPQVLLDHRRGRLQDEDVLRARLSDHSEGDGRIFCPGDLGSAKGRLRVVLDVLVSAEPRQPSVEVFVVEYDLEGRLALAEDVVLGRRQRVLPVPDVVGGAELVHVQQEGQVAEGASGSLKNTELNNRFTSFKV